MAVTNNCGLNCLLYKGGVIKAANRLYNKRIAVIMSEQTKGGTDKFVPTEEYYDVTQRRNNVINDFMLQTGKHFITWCVENRIDTIVMGDNLFWKQKVNIGHKNNQEFVQIPFDRMKRILEYQAERNGIRILRQEESYTSKANFLGKDQMPVYEKDDNSCSFTGTRIHRGLYRTDTGEIINADVNGSANIMRKCIVDAFKNNALMHERISVIKHPMYDAMTRNRTAQKQK
jgi:putative transposase